MLSTVIATVCGGWHQRGVKVSAISANSARMPSIPAFKLRVVIHSSDSTGPSSTHHPEGGAPGAELGNWRTVTAMYNFPNFPTYTRN
jgi:hypothetical protein